MVADVLAVCDTAVSKAVFMGASVDRRSRCGLRWMTRSAFHGWYWSAAMPVWRHPAWPEWQGTVRTGSCIAPSILSAGGPGFRDTRRGRVLIDNFLRDDGDLIPATIANGFRAMEDRDMTDRLPS